MVYPLSDIGNLVVVISGALGSLLLIVFKSKCTSICFGCIKRKVPPIKNTNSDDLGTPRTPEIPPRDEEARP
jgi:hypothetical protein|tara:strand:- start:1225 stop:1440 length:216 start_codon:yes stop_codon:yes gene_type:complete